VTPEVLMVPNGNIIELHLSENNFPDQLSRTGKIVENSTKITCLEIIGDQIKFKYKYSTVLRLLELPIRHSQKV